MVHSPDYRTPWNVRNIYVILATCSRYGKCNATRVLCADELWSVFRVNENKIIFIYQRKKKPYESRAERRRRWSEWMRRFNHQIKEDYFTLSLSLYPRVRRQVHGRTSSISIVRRVVWRLDAHQLNFYSSRTKILIALRCFCTHVFLFFLLYSQLIFADY